MTSTAWRKLKTGSIVRSSKSGTKRRVVRKDQKSKCIILKKVSGAAHRLWSGAIRYSVVGKDTTTYCIGDKLQFDVHRY